MYIGFYCRVFLGLVWFLCASILALVILPFRWKDPSMGAVFARILAFGGQKIFGLNTRIENQSRLYTHQPCIYVANHQSNLDIFTMSPVYPYRTVVIAKKELKWLPLFGIFAMGSGNILIDRSNRRHSFEGLKAAAKYIQEKGLSVWIFPEGTRNRGSNEMLPFKKGAFHLAIAAQVPIVPLVHQHLLSYLEVKKGRINYGDVLIKVLDPIPTTGMTSDDVPKLMAETRRQMEEALTSPEMKVPSHAKTQPNNADIVL